MNAKYLFAGLVLTVLTGCGLEPLEMPMMAPQAPTAQAREASFPAFIHNSQTVPLKYDRNGRLGRLCLNFKARFAGVIPDETTIWEVNGGEKRGGFNTALYPAKDGHLYAIDYNWGGRGEETYYRVGRFTQPDRPLRLGEQVQYQLDFPFAKTSGMEIALPWALVAKGVLFRMDVPKTLATRTEPPFYMVINRGYENRFTPEELRNLPIDR